MRTTAPLSPGQTQNQVEGMIKRGTPFVHVEDAIDASALSASHKAALWLLAWSLRDGALQLQDARTMVAAASRCDRLRERLPRVVPATLISLRAVPLDMRQAGFS